MIGKKFGRLIVLEDTLERKNKHNNCRWVDYKTQSNNRRNNVYLTYDGKTQSMMEWSKELNIPYTTIKQRHRKGYTDKECLFGKVV